MSELSAEERGVLAGLLKWHVVADMDDLCVTVERILADRTATLAREHEEQRRISSELFDECKRVKRELAEAREERDEVVKRLRHLTSSLGFGDGVTEPQASNHVILDWVESESRDANEWRESQRWRVECALAGHPDDQDCWEHDPALQLAEVRERLARVAEVRDQLARIHNTTHELVRSGRADPGVRDFIRRVHDDLTAALHAPADAPQGGSEGLVSEGEGERA